VNETQLIARAQRGDMAAFETLANTHTPYVYNLALRVARDPHEAEDLTQETWLRAWRGLPAYRADAKFTTWLYRIVTNLFYNRLPRLKQELTELDPEDTTLHLPDEHLPPEANLLSKELKAHLHQAIQNLPTHYQLLITLRHLQDLSYTDIAQVTGMPLGTVKTGIFRARQMLKTTLEEYETSHV
jgi:RNA polymerase sigma-70 factor (ECF subfamily)